MENNICILCRGASMILADKYFSDFREMIIVNEFNEELNHDFVRRIFDGKNKITHLISRDIPSILKYDFYKQYGIQNAILNIFKEEYNKGTSVKYLLEHYGLNTSCLLDSMKPFQKEGGGFPTTGVISIVYSTIALQKKDIHIAGMDFYEKDYYIQQEAKDYQKLKGRLMVKYLKNFLRNNPQTKYTFYTHSAFDCDAENVTIIRE